MLSQLKILHDAYILKQKKETFVLKNEKGSILFYVLSFFIYFLIFFESILNIQIKQSKIKESYKMVELRLMIEKEIISFYRINENEEESYKNTIKEVDILAIKIEERINVNLSGAITHAFYYVIMEDGSFTFTTLEEKHDYIK